ncbi:hypothetical protein HDU96_001502 [Phlyctochytrium bullatum]|nr:hypothetical protein HDU96_001502 [Phlyctochytrium bullatum]
MSSQVDSDRLPPSRPSTRSRPSRSDKTTTPRPADPEVIVPDHSGRSSQTKEAADPTGRPRSYSAVKAMRYVTSTSREDLLHDLVTTLQQTQTDAMRYVSTASPSKLVTDAITLARSSETTRYVTETEPSVILKDLRESVKLSVEVLRESLSRRYSSSTLSNSEPNLAGKGGEKEGKTRVSTLPPINTSAREGGGEVTRSQVLSTLPPIVTPTSSEQPPPYASPERAHFDHLTSVTLEKVRTGTKTVLEIWGGKGVPRQEFTVDIPTRLLLAPVSVDEVAAVLSEGSFRWGDMKLLANRPMLEDISEISTPATADLPTPVPLSKDVEFTHPVLGLLNKATISALVQWLPGSSLILGRPNPADKDDPAQPETPEFPTDPMVIAGRNPDYPTYSPLIDVIEVPLPPNSIAKRRRDSGYLSEAPSTPDLAHSFAGEDVSDPTSSSSGSTTGLNANAQKSSPSLVTKAVTLGVLSAIGAASTAVATADSIASTFIPSAKGKEKANAAPNSTILRCRDYLINTSISAASTAANLASTLNISSYVPTAVLEQVKTFDDISNRFVEDPDNVDASVRFAKSESFRCFIAGFSADKVINPPSFSFDAGCAFSTRNVRLASGTAEGSLEAEVAYAVGVAKEIRATLRETVVSQCKFLGSSFGAIVAVAMGLGLDLDLVLQLAVKLDSFSKQRLLFGAGRISSVLKTGLEELIPEDLSAIAKDRVFISVTRLTSFDNEILSEFSCKKVEFIVVTIRCVQLNSC